MATKKIHKLSKGKKIYFASDFHLGVPDPESSKQRELKVIQWLDEVSKDAEAIFLVGDIFDFWFEYKHTIPKGFIRFQGKLAELRDQNIPICFFTGNHDMWMFDYFPKELEIPVYREPMSIEVGDKRLFVGHGDGLGDGDNFYKFLKRIFANKFFQWIFHWAHPNIGMGIARYCSRNSRVTNDKKKGNSKGEGEWLLDYSREIEKVDHHDYYIFGHRHIPLEFKVAGRSTYFNLGEWIHHKTYLEFDGEIAYLRTFDQ